MPFFAGFRENSSNVMIITGLAQNLLQDVVEIYSESSIKLTAEGFTFGYLGSLPMPRVLMQ